MHYRIGRGPRMRSPFVGRARPEQARSALSTAIAMYQSMEMTFWLPQTEAALAQAEGR